MDSIYQHFELFVFHFILSMNNNTKKLCRKRGDHQGRLIQAICLQQQCKNDRLLCFYCVHESHQTHSIAYLVQGLKSPLDSINTNSRIQQSEKHFQFIDKRLKSIRKNWHTTIKSVTTQVKQIQKKLKPEFDLIEASFDKNAVNKMIHALLQQSVSNEEIQSYVNRINMMQKYNIQDVQKLQLVTQIVDQKLSHIYTKANGQIQKIIKNAVSSTGLLELFQKDLSFFMKKNSLDHKFSILNFNEQNADNYNQIVNYVREENKQTKQDQSAKINQKQYKRKKEKKEKKKKKQDKKQKKHDKKQKKQKKNKKHKKQKKNSLQQDNQMQCSSSNKKQKKIEKQLEKQEELQLIQQQIQNQNKQQEPQKNNSKFQSLKHIFQAYKLTVLPDQKILRNKLKLQQERQLQQKLQNGYTYRTSMYPKAMSLLQQDMLLNQLQQSDSQLEQINSNYSEFSQSSQTQNDDDQNVRSFLEHNQNHYIFISAFVSIKISSLVQLKNILLKINPQTIRALSIESDVISTCIDDSSVSIISSFCSLQKLSIYRCEQTKKQTVQILVQNLSSLKILVLTDFQQLDEQLSQLIVQKLPYLQIFSNFNYTSNFLSKIQEDQIFSKKKTNSISKKCLKILAELKKLKIICFDESFDIAQANSTLQKMQNLEQFSFSANPNIKKTMINNTLQILSGHASNLTHIQLKNVCFRQVKFTQMLKNCKFLSSLILDQCKNVSDQTLQHLKQLKSFNQLSLTKIQNFTGTALSYCVNLNILIISQCQNVNQKIFKDNIKYMKKLKCLNLNHNYKWLTNKAFESIKKLQMLSILRIQYNDVGNQSILQIVNLKQIRTLSVGNTLINGVGLTNFLRKTGSSIRKLSFSQQISTKKSDFQQKFMKKQQFNQKIISEIATLGQNITHLNISSIQGINAKVLSNLKKLKVITLQKQQMSKQLTDALQQRRICTNTTINS